MSKSKELMKARIAITSANFTNFLSMFCLLSEYYTIFHGQVSYGLRSCGSVCSKDRSP